MRGFIYALRCEGFVKIGWSKNPEARLRIAKTFNARPVTMAGFYDAGDDEEALIHGRFTEYRVSGSEWFRDEGAVADWASSLDAAANDILTDWIKARRGSQTELAKYLSVTRANISQWRRVPADHLGNVSRFTGIPVEQLRPDIFKAKPKKGVAA